MLTPWKFAADELTNRDPPMARTPVLLVAALASSAAGLVVSPAALRPIAVAPRAAAPAMQLAPYEVTTLLAEILDENGERAYGAVEAPGWVLPTYCPRARTISHPRRLAAAPPRPRELGGNPLLALPQVCHPGDPDQPAGLAR